MSCEPWELIDSLVTIPVVMISKSSGEYLRLALATSPFPISVSLYAPPMLDPEVLVLWALALLSLVGASAWAAAEEKAALEGRSGAGQFLADQVGGKGKG
ncbi:unnamed protein product [Closterium sp. Yama58-4]|nr:unnamed protein product [Closterium sp. Yama58-4]